MAITLVASTPVAISAAGTSTTLAGAIGAAVSVGQTIVVGVSLRDGDGLLCTSVTDSLGNTYTKRAEVALAFVILYVFTSKVTNAGTPTITANYDGAANIRFMHLSAWNDIADSPFDQSGSASGNGTTIQSTSMTPTEDNELIWGMAWDNVGVPVNAGAFTSLASEAVQQSRSQYEIQTTATARTTSFTEGSAANYATLGVTLKQAAAGGGSAPMFRGA